MSKDPYRISYILSVMVIILAGVASAGGLFAGGLYRDAILQTGHPTGVVFATDMSLIISTMTVIAILVLKRNPWGYVLAAVVLLKGLLYPLVLLVGGITAYQTAGIWDPFIPLYIFLWLICIIAYGALLINLKQSNAG